MLNPEAPWPVPKVLLAVPKADLDLPNSDLGLPDPDLVVAKAGWEVPKPERIQVHRLCVVLGADFFLDNPDREVENANREVSFGGLFRVADDD